MNASVARRSVQPQVPSEESLVLEHYPLAQAIARRTWKRLPKGVDLDDLTSVAVMGLIEAVQRFDASRGVPFNTYAKHRILGAIMDSLRSQDWVPRSVRRRADELAAARKRLTEELGRTPTIEELANVLELSVDETMGMIGKSEIRSIVSLDAPIDSEGDATLMDVVADETIHADDAERREVRAAALAALEDLPERERFAVVSFFLDDMPLKEVGAMLGVTESRACQLCKQALGRVRLRMRDHLAV